MPTTTYDTAPLDVLKVVQRMLKHHPDIVETKAKIGAIMASNESGPAVKFHGAAVLAMIQVVSAKRRPHNEYDAEITIDAGEWNKLLPAQQDALVDHELCHLRRKEHKPKALKRLRKEDPNAIAWKLDSLGRPALGTIPADITPGDGFAVCIERHGNSAVEFVTAERFATWAKNARKPSK